MKTSMYLNGDTGEWVEIYEYEPGEAPLDLEELFKDLELISSEICIEDDEGNEIIVSFDENGDFYEEL